MQHKMQHVLQELLLVQHCNNTSAQSNMNAGSNTAGQNAGGGTGGKSTGAATGGTNNAGQTIVKATMLNKMHNVLQELLLVQHATTLVLKAT